MHPRAQVRAEIKEILEASIAGVSVFANRVRDLKKDTREAVLIYTPDEQITRPPGGGEGRTSRPFERSMSVVIAASVLASGDGADAADRADDLAREIELAINDANVNLELTSTASEFDAGAETRAIVIMTFTFNFFDSMEGEK